MKEEYEGITIDNMDHEIFYFDNLFHKLDIGTDILSIVFTDIDDTKKAIVKFDNAIGYRCIEESTKLTKLINLPGIGMGHYRVLKVINSKFIEWFSDEPNVCKEDLIHYIILTDDYIIDVLSYDEFTVEFIKNEKSTEIEK